MEIAFVSPGVLTDAGGFILYIGADGKVHVKRVPPWGPEVRAELQLAFAVLERVGEVKNREVAQQFLTASEHVLQQHAGELQRAVGELQAVG
jgi:hypothetical protein